MSSRDDLVYIRHILTAITKIQDYTQGLTQDEFETREIVQDAVVRQLEIIDEAAKKVGPAIVKQHPEIPWSFMARMRDVLSTTTLTLTSTSSGLRSKATCQPWCLYCRHWWPSTLRRQAESMALAGPRFFRMFHSEPTPWHRT